MDDIEDMGTSVDVADDVDRVRTSVTLRRHGRLSGAKTEEKKSATPQEGGTEDGSVPGVGLVWLRTWGCSHNVSDSEYLAGQLASYGYEVTEDESRKMEADCWVLNSCTVKDPSQASFVNLLRAGRQRTVDIEEEEDDDDDEDDEVKEDQAKTVTVSSTDGSSPESTKPRMVRKAVMRPMPLVLAGCVPQAERGLASLQGLGDGVSLVGVAQLERVVEVVERTMRGECVKLLGKRTLEGAALPSLNLPKVRRNPLVEIVPLSTGCLGSCTYCKTKHARGTLGSYPLDAVVGRVREAIADGVTQVWLSSEDTGAYGIDLGTSFSALLEALTAPASSGGPLDGTDVMVRLGMTNPPYMLAQLPQIAAALKHPNVFAFLHVPVQSGSDPVLHRMNREYTRQEFDQVAHGLSSAFAHPNRNDGARDANAAHKLNANKLNANDNNDDDDDDGLTLATDVICGFPGETDEDHANTLDLCRAQQFPVLNISQFYARPGTPAAKMRRVPNGVAKARSRELTTLFNGQTPHGARLLGRVVTVWIDTERANGSSPAARAPKAAASPPHAAAASASAAGGGGGASGANADSAGVALRHRGSPGDVGAGGGDDGAVGGNDHESSKTHTEEGDYGDNDDDDDEKGSSSRQGSGNSNPTIAVQQTVGHTKSYVKVLLPLNPQLVGCVARVRVESVHRWHVEGTVLSFRKVRRVASGVASDVAATSEARAAAAASAAVAAAAAVKKSRQMAVNSSSESCGDNGCGSGGCSSGGDNGDDCCGGGGCGDSSAGGSSSSCSSSGDAHCCGGSWSSAAPAEAAVVDEEEEEEKEPAWLNGAPTAAPSSQDASTSSASEKSAEPTVDEQGRRVFIDAATGEAFVIASPLANYKGLIAALVALLVAVAALLLAADAGMLNTRRNSSSSRESGGAAAAVLAWATGAEL